MAQAEQAQLGSLEVLVAAATAAGRDGRLPSNQISANLMDPTLPVRHPHSLHLQPIVMSAS